MDNTERLKILKAAAEVSDFKYAVWAYDRWNELNEQYFDGCLEVGGIFWGLTPHGRSLGFYEPWRNAITLHSSLVAPRGDAWGQFELLGEKFAKDVLLHEMIHQHNQQQGYVGKESHNCPEWCDQLNRLIPLLGIETDLKALPIKQKRIDKKVQWYAPDGSMTRSQLSSFPHCLRPKSYYEKPAYELAEKTGLLADGVICS